MACARPQRSEDARRAVISRVPPTGNTGGKKNNLNFVSIEKFKAVNNMNYLCFKSSLQDLSILKSVGCEGFIWHKRCIFTAQHLTNLGGLASAW